MNTKPIELMMRFPPNVWGRLATIADDRGTNIADIITTAVINELRPRDRRSWVLQLVRQGYSDRAIAETTGELKSYVGDVRRAAKLPANRDRSAERRTA
jgi:uncharacterized protein YerC